MHLLKFLAGGGGTGENRKLQSFSTRGSKGLNVGILFFCILIVRCGIVFFCSRHEAAF